MTTAVVITLHNLQNLAENGAPGRIRTCDPRLRRTVGYPTELRAEMALARTTTTNFRI